MRPRRPASQIERGGRRDRRHPPSSTVGCIRRLTRRRLFLLAQEWFYQYKGHMTLKVIDGAKVGERITTAEGLEAVSVEGGQFREITIGEGEMFLLPGESCPLCFSHGSADPDKAHPRRQHAAQPVSTRRHGRHRAGARSARHRSRYVPPLTIRTVLLFTNPKSDPCPQQTASAGTARTRSTRRPSSSAKSRSAAPISARSSSHSSTYAYLHLVSQQGLGSLT